MSLMKRSIAEAIGTLWLVLGGCGAAVLACGVLRPACLSRSLPSRMPAVRQSWRFSLRLATAAWWSSSGRP